MKTPQFTLLDHKQLREAQQILDEIMDDVCSPLHNTKHPMHEQVKEAVAALENEIFLLACNLDGQFQKIDFNNNNQHEKLDPVQNLAQAELCKKRQNRRSIKSSACNSRVLNNCHNHASIISQAGSNKSNDNDTRL